MISKIGKITLYVNNQDDAVKFWKEKMNFEVTFEQELQPGYKWIEVAPRSNKETSLILYDKELMEKQTNQKVVHPSLLFSTTDIDLTYMELKNVGVKVEEMQEMPYGRMFAFYDNDNNTFLIREDK